jgi:anti-sigma factor RsiW
MSNLLQQLENNEAVLLMYLAGELPEDDRAEVEQMLASDPALRRGLEELGALQEAVDETFARADAGVALPRGEAVVRGVGRAMSAARSARVAAPPAAPEVGHSRFRIAWWVYPIAAAAMVVVGILLMADNQPVSLPADQPGAPALAESDIETFEIAPAAPTVTAQIFPDDLETELISLNSDGDRLFSQTAVQDLDR